jgi:hypothetical protein
MRLDTADPVADDDPAVVTSRPQPRRFRTARGTMPTRPPARELVSDGVPTAIADDDNEVIDVLDEDVPDFVVTAWIVCPS